MQDFQSALYSKDNINSIKFVVNYAKRTLFCVKKQHDYSYFICHKYDRNVNCQKNNEIHITLYFSPYHT